MASGAKAKNEELLKRLRDVGNDAPEAVEVMAALWENNLPLVKKVVHEATGLSERDDGFEDMTQQAYFGFLSAVQSYDAASGIEFSTFAGNRVKWSLYRYYENNGYTMRVPTYMRQRIRDCRKKKQELEAETGRSVTYAAALEAMGLSPAAISGTLAALRKMSTVSLNYFGTDDGEDRSLLDVLASGEDVEDVAIGQEWHRELHEMLFKALNDLPEDSRGLIIRHYFHGVSFETMARDMGCSRQAVFLRKRNALNAICVGRYGRELAEFMPGEQGKRRAVRRINEMDRARLEQLALSDTERGLLAL